MAASGEAWYGTNRDDRVIASATITYTEPAPSDVEPVHQNDRFVVEPRTYSSVDHGLVNRRGPNDFGQ